MKISDHAIVLLIAALLAGYCMYGAGYHRGFREGRQLLDLPAPHDPASAGKGES